MAKIEYEALEPDSEDEYYDRMCLAAWTSIFNEGSEAVECFEDPEPVYWYARVS